MASAPGTLRFGEINTKPPAPPVGYALFYIKTDNVIYVQDSSGIEIPLGSASSITQLVGDVTGTGPGITTTTVVSVGGATAADIATATAAYLAATSSNTAGTLVKRDGSGGFSAGTIIANITGNVSGSAASFTGSLAGDVSGTQGATVVDTVGGKTAAAIAQSVTDTQAATNLNTASTIVKRDGSGNFNAGIISAALNGNAATATTAISFSGALSGDVTGTQSATSIASTVVTGKLLTGYVIGANTPILATDTILAAFQKIQGQLSATSGSAITALTGDVTATGPGSVAATIAAIQGTAVAGTTGTGNVVFSIAPTFTGLLSGATAIFTGAISASNLSGTNTGDVTKLDTNSIALTLTGQQISADLKLSSDPADAGNIKATTTVHSGAGAGLHVELPFATPVQIGTSNAIGGASSFALSDHVHAHGNQTSGTLHAVVTSLVNGFMSTLDKVKLDASTALNTASTLVQRDASGNFAAGSITANLIGNISGSAASFTGSLLGDVTGTQSATVVSLVGGKTAAAVAQSVTDTQAATDLNTASTIVKRNASGNFSAGTITANLTGNVSGSAASFTGSLAGDVTGTQSSTVVALVGGKTASAVAQSVTDTQSATDSNTVSTIVKRDASGNFAAGSITANLIGNISGSAATITGSLTGDVTSVGMATTIAVGAVTDTKASLANKPSCAVVSTTNLAVTGLQTIDSVTTVDNTLVLLTGQTSGGQNGPWHAHSGAWTRPTWYPSGGTTQAFQFITILIRLGTTYQGTTWRMTTAGAITIDTTVTVWAETPFALNSSTVTGVLPNANTTGSSTNVASTLALRDANGNIATGVIFPTTTKTANYTITAADGIIFCDTSGGAFSLTLPAPASSTGKWFRIIDTKGTFGANNLTLVRNASEKIEGLAASKVLQTNWGWFQVTSDGTDWYVG